MFLDINHQKIIISFFKELFDLLEYMNSISNKQSIFYRNGVILRSDGDNTFFTTKGLILFLIPGAPLIIVNPYLSVRMTLSKFRIDSLYSDIEMIDTEPTQFLLIHKTDCFKENELTDSIKNEDLDNLKILKSYVLETI